MVGTALVDMYSKCGQLDLACWEAIVLFDQMPERDAISWTSMIGGFVKKGCFEQALEWFREMQLAGVEPDYVTIILCLQPVQIWEHLVWACG
ncbi:Pentatricopeptide repeat-containing protein, chloroplastic [Vitis vinifera]|uniref:Pentatricopeptide repeat-containing protein, chloroplastic n=1 Tax=Vitis vinifera TaxID=29760 RepID=A0A438HGE5_VITVI|nr:Pentatricopeptide repeat-containing protein, chloroplastic [Vitis vinifera]